MWWDDNFRVPCVHAECFAAATSLVGVWVWWGGLHQEEQEMKYRACAHWWYLFYVENSKGAVSSSWSKRQGGTVNPQGIESWQ